MMADVRLEELVPQLPDGDAARKAVLDRAKEIVSAFWADGSDPVLAMAMQVAVQLPAAKVLAVAAIEAMQRLAA
jgi:hypothetical protein